MIVGKPRFVAFAVLLVLMVTVPLWSQSADRPADVSSNEWIRLGNEAGLVITYKPSAVVGKSSGAARAELWLKIDGKWSAATLEQSRQFAPAH